MQICTSLAIIVTNETQENVLFSKRTSVESLNEIYLYQKCIYYVAYTFNLKTTNTVDLRYWCMQFSHITLQAHKRYKNH